VTSQTRHRGAAAHLIGTSCCRENWYYNVLLLTLLEVWIFQLQDQFFSTRPPLYSSLYFILDVFLIFAVWFICFVGLRAPMSRDNCGTSLTVHSMVRNVVCASTCSRTVGFTPPSVFPVTEAIGVGS